MGFQEKPKNSDRSKKKTTQYDGHQLAQLAAIVAAGISTHADLLGKGEDKEQVRAAAREVAKVSLLVARRILVGAHAAAQKEDELQLLYEDADFL